MAGVLLTKLSPRSRHLDGALRTGIAPASPEEVVPSLCRIRTCFLRR